MIAHRGAIKVYSEEGEGTTFTVRIPLIYTALRRKVMKKRKGIAVLLILILSLAVTACGDRYGVKEGESYIY